MSLFDFPTLPGILAPQKQSIAQRVLGGVGSVFGGPNDDRLSAAQNQQARKMAMIQAGLATIGAAENGGSTLGALAQGLQSGVQTGMGMRQNQIVEAEQNRMRQLMADAARNPGETIPKLVGMFNEAMANGDVKAATAIGTVLQSAYAAQPKAADNRPQAPVRGSEEYFKMLEREEEIRDRFRQRAESRGGGSSSSRPAPGMNTDTARMARALSPIMEDAFTRLSSMDTPDLRQKISAKPGLLGAGNYINTPEGRQFRQASIQFLSNALSILSGKTVTEQEVERKEAELIPQPGDDPGTVQAKLNTMRLYARSAREMGGLPPLEESPAPSAVVPPQTSKQDMVSKILNDPRLSQKEKQDLIAKVGK